MKLRNKRTGEIVIFGEGIVDLNQIGCKNVAEMMEAGWEDYEEAKENYILNFNGDTLRWDNGKRDRKITKQLQEIGNYFETEEEAEKAVEKLKAWKRLKDKGFVWQGWEEGAMDNGMCVIGCQIPENNWETDAVEDLDLLFCPEAKNE